VTAPVSLPRSPSALKKVAASALSFVGIGSLMFGLVGLLRSETTYGLLVAGVLMVGGGLALLRGAWRLYRGEPPLWRRFDGYSDEEARAAAREVARGQWLTAAKFLLGLMVVYLLLALLLEGAEAALGAASLVALAAAGLGLLSWVTGRRAG